MKTTKKSSAPTKSNTATVGVGKGGMTLYFNGKSYKDSRNLKPFDAYDDEGESEKWDVDCGEQLLKDVASLPEIKFVIDEENNDGDETPIPVKKWVKLIQDWVNDLKDC